jgi:spore germination protein YaaH
MTTTAGTTSALLRLILGTAIAAAAIGTASASPFVLAYTDDGDPHSYTNLQRFHASLTAVAPGNAYAMQANGNIDSSGVTVNTTHVIAYAKSQKMPIYGTVSDFNNTIQNWDPAITQTVEKTPTSRSHAVTSLVDLAASNGFSGIDLDFEMVGQEAGGPLAADRANHTAFVTALASALHAKGLKLIQSVPASDGTANYAYYDGYDYAALGAVTDYLQVMTYDEVGPGWSSSPAGTWPGPCSGLDWMNDIMAYMVSVTPPAKILLGLPAYGYDFSTGQFQTWAADTAYGTLGFGAYIASKQATTGFDAASYTPYATWGKVTQQSGAYSSANAQPILWYDNPASITAKAALVPKYKLGGTGVWAMGYEDTYFWNAHNTGIAGGVPGNIAPLGTGQVWARMTSATANTGETSNGAINDGNPAVSVTLNPNGEGGAAKWEAAGVTWSSAHTITSVTFINGAIDSVGNGYFQSGLSMQYTTNGTTWVQSNWTPAPAYPDSAAAARKAYTFKGTTIGAVRGVRVAGQTGASSWSGSATEVEVVGK